MNFEQIKKKYPKAWEKFKGFNLHKRTGCFDENVEDYIKSWKFESLSGWLFKFFDEQGMRTHVLTSPNGTFRTYLYKKAGKVWLMSELEDYEYGFQIRQEAEQAVFTKAFEILEQTC